MIRVTIEMIPRGMEDERYHMAEIEIENEGATTLATRGTKGDYLARLTHISRRRTRSATWAEPWKVVQVAAFPRKYMGVYDLLYCVLHSAVGPRNIGNVRKIDAARFDDSQAV